MRSKFCEGPEIVEVTGEEGGSSRGLGGWTASLWTQRRWNGVLELRGRLRLEGIVRS